MIYRLYLKSDISLIFFAKRVLSMILQIEKKAIPLTFQRNINLHMFREEFVVKKIGF